ncbi:uncharacterized protein FFB14_06626 [Fusarium fujikuroi]|nr:uncharacterized protein FFB14_06626 [Fusarium fujikuroi]
MWSWSSCAMIAMKPKPTRSSSLSDYRHNKNDGDATNDSSSEASLTR